MNKKRSFYLVVENTREEATRIIQAIQSLSDESETFVYVEKFDGFTTIQITSNDVLSCIKIKLLYSAYIEYESSVDF